MKLVPLGSVSSIRTGKTPSTADESNFGGDIPFVTPADLDLPDEIIRTPRTLTEKGAWAVTTVPAHSVLVCCIGSLGKVGYTGRAVAMNQQINAVVFDQTKVFPRFGYYACRRLRPEMERLAPATTVAIISKSKFAELEIPLPPLEEQKRIAAILDQADALRRHRARSLDRLNALGQAIFHEMFGSRHSDVEKRKLGDLCTKIGSGATPRGGDSAYKDAGIPLIRSMNVRDGFFDRKGLAFLDIEQAEGLRNVVVQGRDVLLNITGASVARVSLAPLELAGARVNQHVAIIRPKEEVVPEFLEAFLLLPSSKSDLLRIAEAGATRQAITKAQIEEFEVPILPLAEQKKFLARRNEAADQVIQSQRQAIAFETLFNSLQHRAFRGTL